MTYGSFSPEEIRGRAARVRLSLVVLGVAMALPWVLLYSERRTRMDNYTTAVLATVVVSIWAFVLWVRWFHAVHDVVVARGKARLRRRWWLWAWLLPGPNIVVPKLMVDDVCRAGDAPNSDRPVPAVVNWWWACWVVLSLASWILRRDYDLGSVAWVAFPVLVLAALGWLALTFPLVGLLTERAIALRVDHSADAEPGLA